MKVIDLRSDTVSLPTDEMREVMARAEVGDDGYGDDPTVNRLQEISAEITGKEAALYMPSGTMTNLVAIMTHTRPSDSIVMGKNAHSWKYESGGPSAIAGVLPIIIDGDGTFTWDDVEENSLGGDVHLAPTTLVMMENSHNDGGGIVFPQEKVEEIGEKARFWGIKTHIDGARIFNAAVASGKNVAELCAPADTVSFCLSKGLGCPVGSVLCGPADFIERAGRYRELVGGGMRQAGIIAAAGIYALENNVERLADDHESARYLAKGLAAIDGYEVDIDRVETNMVFAELSDENENAVLFAAKLRDMGLLVNPISKRCLRAVTCLNVSRADIDDALRIFEKAVEG